MNPQLQDTGKFGHRINPNLTIALIDNDEPTLHMALNGALKHDATDPLHSYLGEQLRKHGTGDLALNCGAVSFVDSQGLALLLMVHRLCQAQGGKLVIQNPPPMLRQLLKLTRFDTIIKVVDNAELTAAQ